MATTTTPAARPATLPPRQAALLSRTRVERKGNIVVRWFANVIMPLQIGAPDVAFPRLNAFAFWLFFFGSRG